MEAPLLLALTAGMLGAVNPCGFAMLPAYLSLLVAGTTDTRGAVGRALTAAGALTLGYVLVFGAFGLALAPVADWLRPRLPWFTVGLGLLLVLLGCWLLAGRRLPTLRPLARAPRLTRSLPSMVLFGMGPRWAAPSRRSWRPW
ncbi:cytochrome c biogenesis protein CcdA [Micromonospora sp. NPDC049374]|uniref:cytochrome c biogenesis CcdA family protein n=1 Tax=Micromonospora sp. NPDC049374 TaxID=3154352 RepID=UPI0034389EF8